MDCLNLQADDYIKRAKTVSGDAKDTLGEAEQLLLDINEIFRKLKGDTKNLFIIQFLKFQKDLILYYNNVNLLEKVI